MWIYMNGIPTTLENIFDAINPNNSNYWYKVSDKDVGVKYLKSWMNGQITTKHIII